MAETIKGINVVIGAETTGLSSALSDVTKKSKDIQSELKQVEKLLKLDPTNTDLLAQKQKLLSDAVANTKEKLDRLKDAQAQVNDQFAKGEISEGQYRAFQRELASTEEKLNSLQTELGKTKLNLDQIGKSMQEAGKSISDAGGTLSKGLTVPLAAAGGVSLKVASDFESAFAGVRKTVDATEEEFAAFKQGIRDMANTMPQAATEIAGVAEAAGQLGIKNDAILGFTKTMVNMGVATNMSSEDAAMSLARLATITQMNQQDFDRLGATIVGLGNNLAATESEIVEMGLRIAGAGNVVGMSEAQILSFSGALAAVGINAEAGGSAFSKLMIDMANEVATGGKKLDGFAKVAGVSAADFSKSFKNDAAGAIVSFIEGLGKIDKAGGNVFGTLEDLGLSEIRLRDALLRASGAGDLFRNALELGSQAWEENSALTNEAEQRYATFESRLQIMWNRLKDVAITLGDALIPAMEKAMEAAMPLINALAKMVVWFAQLDPGIQLTIITIAALAAALGPALIIIGKLVTVVGSIISAFSALSGAITAAGGVIAVLTGPIGITIAAIAALAAAAYLIYDNWEPIKQFLIDLWAGIVNTTSAAWEAIKSGLTAAWDAVSGTTKRVYNDIASYLTGLWNGIVGFLTTTWDAIKSMARTSFEAVVNVVRPIMDGFKTYFSGLWDMIKNIFAGALLLLIDLVLGDFESLSSDAKAIWNNLKEAFRKMWDGIGQVFSSALGLIGSALSAAWGSIRSTADTAWKGIKTVISSIISATVDWIKEAWNGMLNWFRELPGKLYTIGSDMFNRMLDAVVNTIGTVKDAIVEGISSAIDWIKGLPSEMMQLGKDMIQGMVNGISSMAGKVKDKVSEIVTAIPDKIRDFLGIHSPSRVLMQLGEYAGEGLALGLQNSVADVRRQTAEMAQAAVPKMQSAGTTGGYGEGAGSGSANIIVELDGYTIAQAVGQPLVDLIRVKTGIRI
ncbi:hypothetical protein J31TS4_15840 [Paenibacillus sp. J31TS4]|uniref:phage tail tape measure protein n=1 Tax=Paenibacillus sp. J31TS4 TaxID=2807195 RepID=UPI001B2D03F7|nr:phage tail tape measure protein [Paenibacillus sp. J31TS4]GIP38304.1 hypothetical protein J31TS4_15840 [Paenibacillus sp. J31TS4]